MLQTKFSESIKCSKLGQIFAKYGKQGLNSSMTLVLSSIPQSPT